MKYDIIIAGAGPAGLMLASDLSKDFDVLVLEKGKAGTTSRAWYTFEDRIKENKLWEAVVAKPSYLTFWMDEDSNITYKDKHALINENKVLEIFKERAESDGCLVRSFAPVSDFKYKDERIVVKTNKGYFEGNLLIDCMGTTSPIVLKRNLQNNYNIWVVYGTRMKETKFENKDTIRFYKMNKKYQPKQDKSNYMFGVYPKSKSTGDVYLFRYYDKIKRPEILKDIFNKSVKDICPIHRSNGILKGWIYNGELKKYSLDRVLFAGDAGALTPPFIGMGFNENLGKHKMISERIRHLVSHSGKLDAPSLSDVLEDYRSGLQYTFHRLIQLYAFNYNTMQDWKEGTNVLIKAGKHFTRKWMRNELDISLIKRGIRSFNDVIGMSNLVKKIPLNDFVHIIMSTARITGTSLLKEAHLVFHKQYGDKSCELCKHCGCKFGKHQV